MAFLPRVSDGAMEDVDLRDVQREIKYLRERYERDRDQRRESVERAWFVLMGVMFGFGLGLVVSSVFRASPCVLPTAPPPVAAPAPLR
jgi:hypothetical protein